MNENPTTQKQTKRRQGRPSLTPCSPSETQTRREEEGWDGIPADFIRYELAEKLERQRDEYRTALERIEEIYIDGDDTYEDWNTMGEISREILKNAEVSGDQNRKQPRPNNMPTNQKSPTQTNDAEGRRDQRLGSWIDECCLHDMKTGDRVLISGKAMALGGGEIKAVHSVTGDLEILPDGGKYTQVVGWKCCRKTANA